MGCGLAADSRVDDAPMVQSNSLSAEWAEAKMIGCCLVTASKVGSAVMARKSCVLKAGLTIQALYS